MPSFFSVIRYVPNATAGEAVNVGVVIASGNHIEVRPLENWQRVKCFAGPSWRDVRKLVQDMHDAPSAFFGINGAGSAADLHGVLSAWTRVLQFSDVRASVAPADELAATLFRHVLVDVPDEVDADRRRSVVVKTLYSAMMSAFELRFERRPMGLIKKHARVPGKRTTHKFDVGIVNGSVYAGAFALSFATGQTEKQWKDTDAIAFAVEDMLIEKGVPVAVVLDAPPHDSEPYLRAKNLLEGMPVRLMGFNDITQWANEAVTHVPDSAVA